MSPETPDPRGCDSAPYWPMAVIQECNFMEPEVCPWWMLRGSQATCASNFAMTEFSAPLCQAALLEGARESATRLLKTASQTRLLRHRSASFRDLPSAIFLR
jgi:hypothetical protein